LKLTAHPGHTSAPPRLGAKKGRGVAFCKTSNTPSLFLIPAKARIHLFIENSISYVLARRLQWNGQD